MTGLPFDPMNPPQLAREDRAVAGCSCGGLQWHVAETGYGEGCTIWAMGPEQRQQAIEDAEAVVRAHTDWLNSTWRAYEEAVRRG